MTLPIEYDINPYASPADVGLARPRRRRGPTARLRLVIDIILICVALPINLAISADVIPRLWRDIRQPSPPLGDILWGVAFSAFMGWFAFLLIKMMGRSWRKLLVIR